MYIYDMIGFVLIGLCHILLFLQLIRYQLSWKLLTALSIGLTIILLIVVTVTGYSEMNLIILFIFLLGLGFLQQKKGLTFSQNVFFVLFSAVGIAMFRTILMEISFNLYMMSPFNLYLWTPSVLHLVSNMIILLSLIIWRRHIKKLAQYIVQSSLYYVFYGLLLVSLFALIIVSSPSIQPLHELHIQYGEISYVISIVLFVVLLILFLISSHLSKERLLEEQEQMLDEAMLDYVEKLEVMHDELASFRHDYVNVLLSLDEGIRARNMDMVEKVYRETIAPTSEVINDEQFELVKLSRVVIPEVKSVLSVKVIEAKQQGLTVFIDIPEKIDHMKMPLVQFIRAISIILDNAIEEAVQSEQKSIQLAWFEVDHIQRFIVRNSCQDDRLELENIFDKNYSHKGGVRGLGLFSLKRIIDDVPHATLETSFDFPYVTQMIALKQNGSSCDDPVLD